jgi:hypothetical protein
MSASKPKRPWKVITENRTYSFAQERTARKRAKKWLWALVCGPNGKTLYYKNGAVVKSDGYERNP